MNKIYLDNAATTIVSQEVVNAMLPYYTKDYGNAGSVHGFGETAKKAVDEAREIVAAFMGCAPDHVVFTSGGSEANAIAVTRFSEPGKKLYTAVEHPSIIKAMEDWNREAWAVDHDGCARLEGLDSYLSKGDVDFFAAMYVNNELGSVNNIEAIAEICNRHKVWLHTDCVQAAGNIRLKAEDFGVGSMSISSHKIHGPKGVGALYIRDFKKIRPLIYGGQESGIRGGTENVPGIVGFARACEICMDNFYHEVEKVQQLNNKMVAALEFYSRGHQNVRLFYNTMGGKCNIGKILNIRIDGVDTQTLLMMLDASGIMVSAGSACTSREMHPSHVLKAIGLTDEQAYSSVRISFSKYNTFEEIDIAAKTIVECANILLEKGKNAG